MPKTVKKSNQYGEARKKANRVTKGKKKGAKKEVNSKIKSASELGLKAQSMGIIKKPKTMKAKRILEAREPQLHEGPKRCIMVRGNKSSAVQVEFMRDLCIMRGFDEANKIYLRKTVEIHPFEEIGPLEQRCVKNDCSLFVVSTNQKKRPENMVFGRNFSEHLLDMFEFELQNYQPIKSFKSKEVDHQTKPVLVFQGEQFEFSEKHRRFKNYLQDFFRIVDYDEVNIAEMKRVLVVTATDDARILVRHYELNVNKPINETDVKNRTLSFSEIGPRFDLVFRRDKIASFELYKAACKQPKTENPDKKKQRKNLFTDQLGQKMGKVYLQH